MTPKGNILGSECKGLRGSAGNPRLKRSGRNKKLSDHTSPYTGSALPERKKLCGSEMGPKWTGSGTGGNDSEHSMPKVGRNGPVYIGDCRNSKEPR